MSPTSPTQTPESTVKALVKATGISLRRFAYEMSISPAYAHALVTGERPVTPELARAMAIRYGVHPCSFAKHDSVPYDCHGRQYTKESFEEFTRREPQELEDIQALKLIQPWVVLVKGAARAGRLPLVKLLLRDATEDIVWGVERLSGFVAAANEEAARQRRVYTYGELRGNEVLAEIMGFVDIPGKSDDEAAFEIEQQGLRKKAPPLFDPQEFPEIPGTRVQLIPEPVTSTVAAEPTEAELAAKRPETPRNRAKTAASRRLHEPKPQ